MTPERTSETALLLIDVVNPLDFPGAEALLPQALPMARRIAALKKHARKIGVPVIYVNDNFDSWHLGFRELADDFRARDVPGRPLIDLLDPEHTQDHYVLKPMHSGFFRTPLEVLLQRMGSRTLVLTGIAGDICVLFTANDAYMRGFRLRVPSDCVISERPEDNAHALRQMQRLLKAQVESSDHLF